jgi:imidazolonepropionase-like amidohydrolase
MSGAKTHEQPGACGHQAVAVHGKWLIDGTGRRPVRDGSVVIARGRIQAVGLRREVTVPSGARVIEMPEHTLVPGLVDAHNHVSLHTLHEELPQTTRPEAEVALWGVHWLRKDLESGVTTMRTLGERKLLDVVFKRLQVAGVIEAPRLRIAVHLIVSSLVRVSVSEVVADGADAIRHWVRDAARSGADWIKYYATPNSRSQDPEMPLYSKQEVEVLFEEARMARRPVAAHCHGGQPADWAIELGAASLEHGLFLDERHFAAMGKKGMVLVPTAGVILLQPDEGATPQLVEAKRRARGFLREARRHGVRCVPGTDAVHGNLAFEQQLLVECGWSPQEALECSTREAAVLLGMADQIGTLEPGKLGDLVAVVGDLAEDPTAFGRVRLVIQEGRVVREDAA